MMESAEEFARAYFRHVDSGGSGDPLSKRIRARDVAVALRVLHELQSLIQTNKWLDLMGSNWDSSLPSWKCFT
jgi:hypothetical protein